jgi:type IV pilus assembly protein PilM
MNLKKEIKLSDLKLPGRRAARPPKPAKVRERASAPNELVGLKIGATGLTAAQIVTNGDRRLLRVAEAPLEPGVLDGGEVRDPAALAEALGAFFAENGLPRKGVRLGLGNSRIGVRVIEVAGIEDERQLQNAIAFRAHEMLSVPPDEAVIDYHVLATDVDDEGVSTRRILLVVAYRDSVDRYLAAFDAAGIEVAGIDLESFALLRAVAEPTDPEPGAAATVAVSVGHDRTTLAISDGRTCEFARVLEWGGANLGAAVAHALKLSPSEGEEMKRKLSLAPGARNDFLTPARAAEALEAVRFELQTLVRELLSSLRFYQSQPGSLAIGEILLTGGTADQPGFAEELARELGVAVRLVDPLARVELGDGVEQPERPGALTIAVGLGIED